MEKPSAVCLAFVDVAVERATAQAKGGGGGKRNVERFQLRTERGRASRNLDMTKGNEKKNDTRRNEGKKAGRIERQRGERVKSEGSIERERKGLRNLLRDATL